jgi:TonB-linked SusC/RagA family outer membrane protein
MKNKLCVMISGINNARSFKLFKVIGIVLLLIIISTNQTFASEAYAKSTSQDQERLITGKVTDKDNVSLPGVAVVVKGATNIGMITDEDGNYSLSVPQSAEMLQFSFVGMKTQEVEIGNKSVINVVMEQDVVGLEEVIAVGYGVQKKTTVTGAISTVKGDELADTPVPDISHAIAGKLAGVSMRPNGGQPGFDDPDIHIRGIVTTGDNAPLVVVDGVKRDNIRQIDPATIESITILKDAAAVAPYGIGGANGVILITTKQGQAGRPVVRLTASYGVQNPTYLPNMLSAKDYMALQNEGYYNLTPDGTTPPNDPELIANYDNLHQQDPDLYPDSKFIDAWNTSVPVQNYNLELSGGTQTIN